MMGTGEAEGENRAIRAAEAAINNPLLEDTSMSGARGLLINITGGDDLTLFEVDEAANRIRQEVDEEANVIFGSAVDESLTGKVRVSVVATGIDSQKIAEAARPKLVAMGGGGGAAPAPQPIVMRGGPAPAMGVVTPAGAPAGAPAAVISAFRQPSAAPHLQPVPQSPAPVEALVEAPAHAEEHMAAEPVQAQPAPTKLAPPQQPRVQPVTGQGFTAPNPRSALFAEPQRPVAQPGYAAEARPSLFSQMTGAFRRRPTGGVAAPATQDAPVQPRAEPARELQADLRVAVRQTSAAEEALEIPAFLRRQQSTH
jgi:cell division protein FtsZ